MSASDYLEGKVLDHVFGATAYTAPTRIDISLHSADPGEDGSNELSGGSYARVQTTNNTTNWPNASGGVKSNGTAVTFPTASANWTAATHWGAWDQLGNFICGGALGASKTVQSGDTASFGVGDIDITMT